MYIINEEELQALKRIKRYLEIYLQYDIDNENDKIYFDFNCLDEDYKVLEKLIEDTQ